MPVNTVYCPYCGRPQFIVPPQGRPAVIPVRRAPGKSNIGFILSLLSGILVVLNAAFLLVPSFYALWSSIFFWLPRLGPSYAFVLGLIIGLVIIMGSIIMLLSKGALADVIIFPFAIFSLIIGGGFVAGMIFGIVGGILGVLKR